jgi:hypothetical protein
MSTARSTLILMSLSASLNSLSIPDCVAQTLFLDEEPNDTPQLATAVSAPATLMGSMASGDQDGYAWMVSDVDAGRRWTLELQGIPGRLTVVDIARIAYDENREVSGAERLLKFGTRDGSHPAIRSDLIFEPGEYLLGLASAGGSGAPFRPQVDMAAFSDEQGSADTTQADPQAYRLFLRNGTALPAGDGQEHTSRETARPVTFNRDMMAFLDGNAATWYRLDVSEPQSASRWNIQVQVPVGRLATVTLFDAEQVEMAKVLTEPDGKATLADISVPPGGYFLEITPNSREGELPGYIQLLTVMEVGTRIEGEEAEPNDRWTAANQANFEACCTGRVGQPSDTDMFAFTLSESQANQRQQLVLNTAPEHTARLCLLNESGVSFQCRQSAGGATLDNLLLSAGDYGVSVRSLRGAVGTEYSLSLQSIGAPEPGMETEPNDTDAWAIGTPENNRIKGAFDGQGDVDFYRFIIADEAQLWRVQAIGPNIANIAYHDLAGTPKQRLNVAPGQRRARLDNLFLFPGTHLFSVTGRDAGSYTLLARALGPPDPDAELEPNDDATRMLPLRIGQTRTGILSSRADVDQYRFHLPGRDHVVLTATPPVDGKLSAQLEFAGTGFGQTRNVDGPIVLEGILPPGDYHLTLKAVEPSDAEYQLSLKRKATLDCTGDCEPNNSAVFANLLPTGGVVDGTAGVWADTDWFELPESDVSRPVRFQFESTSGPTMRFYNEAMDAVQFELDRTTSTYSGTLPANQHLYAQVGRGPPLDYRFTTVIGDGAAPASSEELPVDVEFDVDASVVSPYQQVGQSIGSKLRILNTGAAPLELNLDFQTTDDSWRVNSQTARVSVPAGQAQSLDIDIVVPPDVRADRSVRIGVTAVTDDGRHISAVADIAVDPEAATTNPVRAWPIPESLRGGFNVARSAFGATAVTEPNRANQYDRQLPQLFDGMGKLGNGLSFGNRDVPQTVTVDLAGDAPVPVTGFVLNPLYGGYRYRTPYDVEFQLSVDGTTFSAVATGVLTTIGTDHFYVLDEPVPARFARLVLDTSWESQPGGGLTLGEWKVVAKPGFDPLNGASPNLASPGLGGHVVWSKPALTGSWNINILTENAERPVSNVPPNEPLEWVVGFHHNRAARIERVVWNNSAGNNVPVEQLAVSVSLESPVGPWQPVATWARATDGDVLVFDSPVWARFVRFVVSPADERRVVDLPETLEIREAPTGPEYRSVLSEWGFLSRPAYYESTLPLPARAELTQRGNESRNTPADLRPDTPEAGRVKRRDQSQWYRPVLPEGHNTMTLALTGDPTVRTELELTRGGEPISLRRLDYLSRPSRVVYEAYLEPGDVPLLEVREPPRNVMFLWDTSPSMGTYIPLVYNALIAYAEDLVPGIDMANLLPFGASGPLLRNWNGEPYVMQLVLNDQPRTGGSSAAELSQYMATRALASRNGTKAIVMITDAHTSAHRPMWDALKEVQPRVFTIHVGTEDTSQDLMQDWASVNGGHYAYVIGEGEMEIAFERAAAMLRRPADYTLTMTTEFREAPGPGWLKVTSGDTGAGAAGSAVELILDASGSMLQRMEGRRRIEIAREVLTTAIDEHIPSGTPTALRVFGHRTPNACETDLVIPLAPLEPAVVVQKLAGIQAKNLARTPIADSLAEVSRDLRGATNAVVVLVTDGEETCDGDPGVAIERLRSAGLSVSVNIVGFAIDDDSLANQFRIWAEAGGGRYFAANNAAGLAEAVAQALATPFTVFDRSGGIVAEGLVDGEDVELPQGVYRVVVNSSPAAEFNDISITGEQVTTLNR